MQGSLRVYAENNAESAFFYLGFMWKYQIKKRLQATLNSL